MEAVDTRAQSKALHRYDLEMAAYESNVGLVRGLVDQVARASGVSDPVRRDGRLVLTELVTNAVKLYEGAQLRVWVTNPIGTFALDLNVWDPDPMHGPVLLPPSEVALDGRGIHLVSVLTHGRWGFRLTEGPDGKVVWGRVS